MKYIVREPDKTGGTIHNSPDDAIDAAVQWELETGVQCEIWTRYEGFTMHPPVELHSIPHTMEAREAVLYLTEGPKAK